MAHRPGGHRSGPGWGRVALVEGRPSSSAAQDLAVLTAIRYLPDLRLAQPSSLKRVSSTTWSRAGNRHSTHAPSGQWCGRAVVRVARLIHRRGHAFWPACGPRRLRRQSKPALIATHGGTGWRRHADRSANRSTQPASSPMTWPPLFGSPGQQTAASGTLPHATPADRSHQC